MSKNNTKLAQKLQSDINSSKPAIISNDDNMSFLKKKYGNKYDDDVSDTEDDLTSIQSLKNKPKNNDNQDDKQSKKKMEFSEEFKNMVKQYIKSDDKLRLLSEEMKEYRNKKKQAEDFIIKNLEHSKIDLGSSVIYKNEHESKTALKQDIIKEALMKKLNDNNEVEKLLKLIDEKRGIVKRVSLKRIFDK